MDTLELIALVLAGTILAVRLYLKYIKKGKEKSDADSGNRSSSEISSSSKDNDYEPYARK